MECSLCTWLAKRKHRGAIRRGPKFAAFVLDDAFADHHSLWAPLDHIDPLDFLTSRTFFLIRDYLLEYINQEGFLYYSIHLDFRADIPEGTHALIHLLGNRSHPLPQEIVHPQELPMFSC